VTVGTTSPFEILTLDLEKKRIGVALVPEGSSRAAGVGPSPSSSSSSVNVVPGARLTGKVERHEPFGVFVFLAPGRTGLIPMSETGVARDGDVAKTFPIGGDVEVIVLEVDAPPGRRIRLSAKAVQAAREAEEVRAYTERSDAAVTSEGFGSLADKLRGALTGKLGSQQGPRKK
jgi:ribosomal protein S1